MCRFSCQWSIGCPGRAVQDKACPRCLSKCSMSTWTGQLPPNGIHICLESLSCCCVMSQIGEYCSSRCLFWEHTRTWVSSSNNQSVSGLLDQSLATFCGGHWGQACPASHIPKEASSCIRVLQTRCFFRERSTEHVRNPGKGGENETVKFSWGIPLDLVCKDAQV